MNLWKYIQLVKWSGVIGKKNNSLTLWNRKRKSMKIQNIYNNKVKMMQKYIAKDQIRKVQYIGNLMKANKIQTISCGRKWWNRSRLFGNNLDNGDRNLVLKDNIEDVRDKHVWYISNNFIIVIKLSSRRNNSSRWYQVLQGKLSSAYTRSCI